MKCHFETSPHLATGVSVFYSFTCRSSQIPSEKANILSAWKEDIHLVMFVACGFILFIAYF